MFDQIFRLLLSELYGKVDTMAGELEALKAAVAADQAADDKLVAYLATVKANLDAISAQLAAMQAQEMINPADIQAIADQLKAHSADVATHLPADPAPAAPAA